LLHEWDDVIERFTRVMPRDYARVTEIRRRAEVEGLDPDGDLVWSQIMEATRG
jgi:glutamate synthase (NADPH/NADH) large chain